MTLYLAT